jgi:DNA-binding MarR family transcriptional regulator
MIEPATLVGVLDRMESSRLISRSSSLDDRRRKVIRAHPEAEEVWAKVADCARSVRAQATQGLSDRQVLALRKTLRTVLRNLQNYQLDQSTLTETDAAK